MTKNKKNVVTIGNTEELLKALGLSKSEAPKLKLRIKLVTAIRRSIEKQGLTHHQAASKAKVGRTVITAIVNCNIQRVSTDRLIDVAHRLGLNVDLKVA